MSVWRPRIDRRDFLRSVVAGAGGVSLASQSFAHSWDPDPHSPNEQKREYRGPNVIIIRFGGGVRRKETIDPDHTYSPFLVHELVKRGTLFPHMELGSVKGLQTSHGPGTLNILTGKYDKYEDVSQAFLGERFEAKVPTLFEYFRKTYDVSETQTLIVNGEDRTDEEFYTFSNHHLFGIQYRCNVLSLYRFKVHLLREQILEGKYSGKELREKKKELAEMESLDHRVSRTGSPAPQLSKFWDGWRRHYGETGLVNPRGDRVLTELAIRAIAQLRPKLMMINYQDCDYVHWGIRNHYTRGIQIMDQGLRQLVAAVNDDEAYRENTLFAVVPDCGRDTNPFAAVPFQHHFGSRSSHEIFALLFGPGVPQGKVVDRKVEQISVAATVGQLMGLPTPLVEGPVLEEAIT